MAVEWTQAATVRKGGVIEVVCPQLQEGAKVEVVVRGEGPKNPARRFGSARGQGHMREDFEAPLDDFADHN